LAASIATKANGFQTRHYFKLLFLLAYHGKISVSRVYVLVQVLLILHINFQLIL